MAKQPSKRERNRIRQNRQNWINAAIAGGIALAIIGILGILFWQGFRPAAGEAISIPPGYETHVEVGASLTYPSDPPAGGLHYAEPLEAGFYDENTIPVRPGEPAGYLVHNLEHGYVIFWYNCANLDETACGKLKSDIKAVMDAKNNFKLIAFPWESIDTPLVMTSWGRLQRFQQFDAQQARAFIENNLNRAPEAEAR